jgi:hypothetical protein
MQSVFVNMSRLVIFLKFFSNFSLGFEIILPPHVLFSTSDRDFMDILYNTINYKTEFQHIYKTDNVLALSSLS